MDNFLRPTTSCAIVSADVCLSQTFLFIFLNFWYLTFFFHPPVNQKDIIPELMHSDDLFIRQLPKIQCLTVHMYLCIWAQGLKIL